MKQDDNMIFFWHHLRVKGRKGYVLPMNHQMDSPEAGKNTGLKPNKKFDLKIWSHQQINSN